MPAPAIDFVKTWGRIDVDEFDAILPALIASATAMASHETGVDYSSEAMPEAVQCWVAANVSYWVDNPTAATDRAMSPAPYLSGLLDPYRTYSMEVRPPA